MPTAPQAVIRTGASPNGAASLALIPGAPLIQILFLSQALNAALLLVLLPFLRSLGADSALMEITRSGEPSAG